MQMQLLGSFGIKIVHLILAFLQHILVWCTGITRCLVAIARW